MRTFRKKRLVVLLLLSLVLINTNVSAYSRDFVYDFTHHIPGKVYNGTASTIKIALTVSSWGSSSFEVRQTKHGIYSTTVYATQRAVKSLGNKQTLKYSNHGGCQYEFWKAQDGKRIKGTGNIVW